LLRSRRPACYGIAPKFRSERVAESRVSTTQLAPKPAATRRDPTVRDGVRREPSDASISIAETGFEPGTARPPLCWHASAEAPRRCALLTTDGYERRGGLDGGSDVEAGGRATAPCRQCESDGFGALLCRELIPARPCICTTLTRSSRVGFSWSSQASTRSATTLARAAPFWSSRGFVCARVSGSSRAPVALVRRRHAATDPLTRSTGTRRAALKAEPVTRREASTRRRPATLRA
jgi:hypothetical protein